VNKCLLDLETYTMVNQYRYVQVKKFPNAQTSLYVVSYDDSGEIVNMEKKEKFLTNDLEIGAKLAASKCPMIMIEEFLTQ